MIKNHLSNIIAKHTAATVRASPQYGFPMVIPLGGGAELTVSFEKCAENVCIMRVC